MNLKLLALLLVISAPAVAAQSSGISRQAESCQVMSEYTERVAKLRDNGKRLSEVKAINAEQSSSSMLGAYNYAATIVYRHPDMSPSQIKETIYSGCMSAAK